MRVLLKSLLSIDLLLLDHGCVILALDLTQYFAMHLLPYLLLFNLIAAVLYLLITQSLLFEKQIIVKHGQRPVSTECFVQHFGLVVSCRLNFIEVVVRSLDACVATVRLLG